MFESASQRVRLDGDASSGHRQLFVHLLRGFDHDWPCCSGHRVPAQAQGRLSRRSRSRHVGAHYPVFPAFREYCLFNRRSRQARACTTPFGCPARPSGQACPGACLAAAGTHAAAPLAVTCQIASPPFCVSLIRGVCPAAPVFFCHRRHIPQIGYRNLDSRRSFLPPLTPSPNPTEARDYRRRLCPSDPAGSQPGNR